MNFPLIFNSKKATLAIVSAFVTFLLSILPIVFPDIDPSIFQEAADFIMKIMMFYLPSQAAVDVAKALKANNDEHAAS